MKKICLKAAAVLTAAVFIFSCNGISAEAEKGYTAKSAILIEASTGRVLYEQNAFEKLPMASTTKIMTAILAIENCRLDETITVSPNASVVGESSIWLSVGEKLTVSDMLFGLMLASGNDAAVAIAEHVGGSVEEFAKMMNEKAKEIGAYNTNFVNPNGLPAENHYTTAYDLALISAYAMKNDFFKELVKTEYKTIPWEGHEWNRVVKNKNKILWQYDGGNGIKTGYTKAAGKCLCAAAYREGMQLVSVVLGAPDMFNDSMKLLDYGFNNYSYKLVQESGVYMGDVAVTEGTEEEFAVYTDEEVYYPLTEEEYEKLNKRVYIENTLDAPVNKGQNVGYIDVWLGSNRICSVALKAPCTIGENSYGYNLKKIFRNWTGADIK